MNWIFYALSTNIFYSFGTYIDKFILEKRLNKPLILTSLGAILNLLLGLIILSFLGFPKIPFLNIILLMVSGCLLVFYLIPYFLALQLEDTSVITPLFQFIPIFVLILGYLLLRETLNLKQLVGFVIIFISGFLLTANKINGSFFKPRKSLWLMLLASFIYALFVIFFRAVVRNQNFWPAFGWQNIGSGVAGLSFFIIPKIRRDYLKNLLKIKIIIPIMTVNCVICILAVLLESYALSLVPAAFVSIVGGTQPLFTFLFGLILSLWFPHIIKEDISKSMVKLKLATIVSMFAGLYLIYF